jgi:hypothetical protein
LIFSKLLFYLPQILPQNSPIISWFDISK